MRKIFLLAAFCAFNLTIKAQNAVLFKIKYLPFHTYSVSTKMTMNMDMDYNADSVTLKQMKASGAKLPVIMQVEINIASDLKTRKYNLKHELPFTLNLKQSAPKVVVLTPVPVTGSDDVVYGRYSATGKLTLEGLQGKTLTDSARNAINGLMKTIETNVDFPKGPIKVGDSFAQDIDTDVPIPGVEAKMKMKVIYKLLSMAGGRATFGMDITTTTDKNAGDIDVKGIGTGRFVYDIGMQCTDSMTETVDMTYVRLMPQQNVSMKGKAQMTMSQQTIVK